MIEINKKPIIKGEFAPLPSRSLKVKTSNGQNTYPFSLTLSPSLLSLYIHIIMVLHFGFGSVTKTSIMITSSLGPNSKLPLPIHTLHSHDTNWRKCQVCVFWREKGGKRACVFVEWIHYHERNEDKRGKVKQFWGK